MSEWPSFTVAELQRDGTVLVEDGNHGEYRPRPNEFIVGGTAYIRAADISDGQVRFAEAGGINDAAMRRLRKGIGSPGDILFSHKGTVGKLARVPMDAPPFVCSPQTTFWRVLDEARLCRDYLYAFMGSRAFIDQWWARKGETDMADYVSLTAQRQLRVTVPPIDVQRRRAAPLHALDGLIENNRRRIELLEQMAHAIYREWFVRFRYPGHEDDALTDSPLGPIPQAWHVGTISDHLTLQRGFDLPTSDRLSGTIPVATASGVHGSHSEAKARGPGVVTGRSGTIGVVTYIPEDYWPLNTVLWVKEFRLATPVYAYHLLASLDLKQAASGAAVPTLNRNHVHALPAICPPVGLIQTWEDTAQPMVAAAASLRRQAQTLESMRALLLPKLVTGRIDVSKLDLDARLDSVA